MEVFFFALDALKWLTLAYGDKGLALWIKVELLLDDKIASNFTKSLEKYKKIVYNASKN